MCTHVLHIPVKNNYQLTLKAVSLLIVHESIDKISLSNVWALYINKTGRKSIAVTGKYNIIHNKITDSPYKHSDLALSQT